MGPGAVIEYGKIPLILGNSGFPSAGNTHSGAEELILEGEEEAMSRQRATVEQVGQVQNYFKAGVDFHGEKKFKEAIESFNNAAAINPFQEDHLDVLSKKLTAMSVKLVQESIAYMGCAAVHLKGVIDELSENERELVPVDDSLLDAFKDWD